MFIGRVEYSLKVERYLIFHSLSLMQVKTNDNRIFLVEIICLQGFIICNKKYLRVYTYLKMLFNLLFQRILKKAFSHFDYLKNYLHNINVIWRPIRRNLLMHVVAGTLPWVNSVISEIPLNEIYTVWMLHWKWYVGQGFWQRISSHRSISLLAFSKREVTVEKEEISDKEKDSGWTWWDS